MLRLEGDLMSLTLYKLVGLLGKQLLCEKYWDHILTYVKIMMKTFIVKVRKKIEIKDKEVLMHKFAKASCNSKTIKIQNIIFFSS